MSGIGNKGDVALVRTKEEERLPVGTHQGSLTPEERAVRRAKNLRNQSRRGQATRARGSSHRPFRRAVGQGVKSSRRR